MKDLGDNIEDRIFCVVLAVLEEIEHFPEVSCIGGAGNPLKVFEVGPCLRASGKFIAPDRVETYESPDEE